MKASLLQQQLLSKYSAEKLDVEMKETPGITGAFEVIVDGKIVHSKQNGDGFVDDENKLQKIQCAINTALTNPQASTRPR